MKTRKTLFRGWIGFVDGKPATFSDVSYTPDGVRKYDVFVSKAGGHTEYEDVRRVTVIVEALREPKR